MHLKGVLINAKEHAADMRAAISEVADEILRQVDKRRERTRKHRKTGTPTIRHTPDRRVAAEAEG